MASSNLTVKSAGSPWGSTKRSFVPAKVPSVPLKREVVELMAERHRLADEQRNREKLLKGPAPALSAQYHVHLSHDPDYSTNSSAK